MRMWLVTAFVFGACGGGGGGAVKTAAPAPAPAPVEVEAEPAPVPDEKQQAREAWLAEVAGYVAAPATIPRWSDPAGRAAIEALTSDPAWLGEVDVERDGAQMMRFFPAAKALSIELTKLHLNDENALLVMYLDEVNRGFIAAGEKMLARATGDQSARREGLERMRIGLAMNQISLLSALEGTSEEVQRRVLEHFDDDATFAAHSATSLQFLHVTIEDRIAKAPRGLLRSKLAGVRREIEEAQKANGGTPDRVYEPLTIWPTLDMQTVVSRSGGFAATSGPGTLVWRARGVHHLEWRSGELTFEVKCFDDTKEHDLTNEFTHVPMTSGPAPGTWFTLSSATTHVRGRVTAIGEGRACRAYISAPSIQVPARDLDNILASLRPAP